MRIQSDYRELGCAECSKGAELGFDFTMAFQPIVDTTKKEIFAYEALVRGLKNEPAGAIFELINDSNRYRFDQCCRTKAIQLAAKLGMQSVLSINFMPNAVYRPDLCIRTTLEAANLSKFPIERIIFEITEGEKIDDVAHVREIVQYYKSMGFKTAIDDFGAGYAGLNLLAEIQTDYIKVDMALVRNIHLDKKRQAIIKGILQFCKDLTIIPIAEGIEVRDELSALQALGIELFQGYYFARPAFETLTPVALA